MIFYYRLGINSKMIKYHIKKVCNSKNCENECLENYKICYFCLKFPQKNHTYKDIQYYEYIKYRSDENWNILKDFNYKNYHGNYIKKMVSKNSYIYDYQK